LALFFFLKKIFYQNDFDRTNIWSPFGTLRSNLTPDSWFSRPICRQKNIFFLEIYDRFPTGFKILNKWKFAKNYNIEISKKTLCLKLKKALYYILVHVIAIIFSLIWTNFDDPNQRNKDWRMTYAQKSFLSYFGQNGTKIQKIFFVILFIKALKKSNKSFKILLKKILFWKSFLFHRAPSG